MESKGFKCLINEPTHVMGGVLDLVFVSVDFCIQSLKIFDYKSGFEISDHYPIKLDLKYSLSKAPFKVSSYLSNGEISRNSCVTQCNLVAVYGQILCPTPSRPNRNLGFSCRPFTRHI